MARTLLPVGLMVHVQLHRVHAALLPVLRFALPLAVLCAAAAPARAAVSRGTGETATPEAPWEPTQYPLEVEPHGAVGIGNVFGGVGVGGGVRFGAPIAGGHLGRVPQNLAVSLGADFLHYEHCYYGAYCGADYLLVPAALQWNVGVARPLSLFVEGGGYVYKGWFDGCTPGEPTCSAPRRFGVMPTIAVGGRLHLSGDVALTLRAGYPASTLGLSFM